MRRIWLAVFIVLLGFAAAPPAFADDFAVPPWWGAPRSQAFFWEFGTNANPSGPDTWLKNDDGSPLDPKNPTVTVSDMTWADGQWTSLAAGSMDFNLPNYHAESPDKLVRVQVTYTTSVANQFPEIFRLYGFTEGMPETWGEQVTGWTVVDATHAYTDWRLRPNPWQEELIINFPAGMSVSEVVVDTICPEPGTLLLLAGGIMALRRRRRA